MPIAAEFTVLTLLAAGTVIAIHEGLVRRFGLVRLLFNGKTDIEEVRNQPGLIKAFSSASPASPTASKPRTMQSGATGSSAFPK